MSSFKVIETPHADPSSARSISEYATSPEARIGCAQNLKANLNSLVESGLTANEMLKKWKDSGLGYRIEPEDANTPFSDVDFARLFVMRLTNDYSHPLYFEVATVDCLRTASGVNSPKSTWKFWVRAPLTYEGGGLDDLINAAVELLYNNMSQQSRAADGSRYVLLEVKYKTLTEDEAHTAIKADPNATIYYVQNDGSFGKNVPAKPMTVPR